MAAAAQPRAPASPASSSSRSSPDGSPLDLPPAAAARLAETSRRRPRPAPWSSPASSPPSAAASVARLVGDARRVASHLGRRFVALPPLYRALVCVAGLVLGLVLLLTFVYSSRLFSWLAPVVRSWRARPAGWLILFFLVVLTSIPPLVGYSTVSTLAGFVYGFPAGWPVVAAGCVVGSEIAFLASRTILSAHVHRLVGRDHRFLALSQVLRREGILYLTAVRLCPLPFSLSNGFLATIPTISPLSFAIATALSSPKLLVHVFIGSRLALLAETGDSMSSADKAINYISMFVGAAVSFVVGLVIYRRTMARADQLSGQTSYTALNAEADEEAAADSAALLDPEDAAAVMSDDDLSLWDALGPESDPQSEPPSLRLQPGSNLGRDRRQTGYPNPIESEIAPDGDPIYDSQAPNS